MQLLQRHRLARLVEPFGRAIGCLRAQQIVGSKGTAEEEVYKVEESRLLEEPNFEADSLKGSGSTEPMVTG